MTAKMILALLVRLAVAVRFDLCLLMMKRMKRMKSVKRMCCWQTGGLQRVHEDVALTEKIFLAAIPTKTSADTILQLKFSCVGRVARTNGQSQQQLA